MVALHHWDTARSAVPEEEAQEIYEKVDDPTGFEPIPTDAEGFREAVAMEAFALLAQARRFEVQARAAVSRSENAIPEGAPSHL